MMGPACVARANELRERFDAVPTHKPSWQIVARRMAYDAPAAGDYPRVLLQDAAHAAFLVPDLAPEIWHHAAGATIDVARAPYCCSTPAEHGYAFQAIAGEIIRRFAGAS